MRFQAHWTGWLALAFCFELTACRSFEPLDSDRAREVLNGLTKMSVRCVRIRRSVELESKFINGTFEAVLISVPGPEPAGRLQLLPPVGPKLLDLAFDQSRIAGYFPAASVTLSVDRQSSEVLPRHPLSFMAASLIEGSIPLATERILGERQRSGQGPGEASVELLLDSAVEGCTVSVLLDDEGSIVGRNYRLRRVRWTERHEGDRVRFEGRGFSWTMGPATIEDIPQPSDELFKLEVPGAQGERRRASSGALP